MPSSLKYTDVMNMLQRQIPRISEDTHAETIINAGLNMIWMAYDWRESLSEFTPFYLIPGRQDYPEDIIDIPSDMHGIKQAFFVRLNGDTTIKTPLKVIKQLNKTSMQLPPNAITFMTTMADNKSGYRIHPRPPQGYGAPYYMIEGTYKKRTPVVTASTLTNTIAFDDMYQGVLFDACLYQAKRMSGAQDANNHYQNAVISITQMANAEGLADGESSFAPSEPLVSVPYAGVPYPNYFGY